MKIPNQYQNDRIPTGREAPTASLPCSFRSNPAVGGHDDRVELSESRMVSKGTDRTTSPQVDEPKGPDLTCDRERQAVELAEEQSSKFWGPGPMPDNPWLSLDPRVSGQDGPTSATIDTTRGIVHFGGWKHPGEIPFNGIDDDGNGYVDDVYGLDLNTGKGLQTDDFLRPNTAGRKRPL